MSPLNDDPDAPRHQFTVCIVGESTDWVETLWACNVGDAIEIAKRTCADDWHMYTTSSLEVRFVMAGDVQILEYNDIR